ncbi:uncharacterized protein VP01_2540g8 [Puccinia sorghi]|uniref:Uncharacterized protein n=1 Tax=Puccinia sorghi TaxID=27349 RepID=A0A0L6V746_9BASI|nr:uncharacterized protein VP01_2540g8 [Puccinia sorghi]
MACGYEPSIMGIITALGYKNLDDYVLAKHTADMYLERFVPDIKEYEPKKLWDAIVAHFAEKTVENLANALDKLFDTQFNEGDMKKSVDTFRTAFQRVVEVSTTFDRKSLEAVAAVFALQQLPPSFAVFGQLQFAGFKDNQIEFHPFLKELEIELRCQTESVTKIAESSQALVVSQIPGATNNGASSNKKKGK